MGQFDAWDPSLYNKFATEREQPFWDLRDLIHDVELPAVVDLGCGDGRLTAELADSLKATSMLGVDSSAAMIAATSGFATDRITFRQGDISAFEEPGAFDIVFANASLQWVSGHASVLQRWANSLRSGGQLCVQVPANADHPSHTIAAHVASEVMANPPPDVVASNVLAPERYAAILHELGFSEQHVRLEVYAHLLESSNELVEWVKGTSLNRLKKPLGSPGWEEFVELYRQRVLQEVGTVTPYFYPFKRILMWARRD